jgi:hypothetical protein
VAGAAAQYRRITPTTTPWTWQLLTMIGSLEAIFLSIFVMVSQNRQAEKDRLRIDLDYQVNLKAQTEIVRMSRKLDRLEAHLMPTPPDDPGSSPAPGSSPSSASLSATPALPTTSH